MIPWLDDKQHDDFPPLESALAEPVGPNGLLAAGGGLSAERLIAAYRRGIFPWYSPGDPLLWWSPDPRMVLFPGELKVSRSLNKTLARKTFIVSFDRNFTAVMSACANTPRDGQNGTWISDEMIAAYSRLHELGYAHSVEAWMQTTSPSEAPPILVGGLYGVAIGRMFYGESMFSRVTDASKAAFVHLVRFLQSQGYGLIDCQMRTDHLASLGAREISRAEFSCRLAELTAEACVRWPDGPPSGAAP